MCVCGGGGVVYNITHEIHTLYIHVHVHVHVHVLPGTKVIQMYYKAYSGIRQLTTSYTKLHVYHVTSCIM